MPQIDKQLFFELTRNFSYIPFTQSEGFWNLHSLNNLNRFVFFVDNPASPQIACMGNVKKFLNKKLIQIEGECLLSGLIEEKQILNFYAEITKEDYDFIEINSALPYDARYEIAIRRAGFLRPAGMFSTQLSIILDLNKPINYDKNWRKNLRRANSHNLSFNVIANPTEVDFQHYLLMNDELAHRKKLHNELSRIEQLEGLFSKGEFLLFFVEDEKNIPVAGMIVYAHQTDFTTVFSATSDDGRKTSASYFLHQEMFSFMCKEKGMKQCDMGRISPSINEKNNIFLFKNGVNGSYVTYNGEWSWYKKPIYRPVMYFVKKYLFKRIDV